jgi:hypothetical protein
LGIPFKKGFCYAGMLPNLLGKEIRRSGNMRIIKSMEEAYKLPAPECLMVKELVPGSLDGMHGQVCYSDYTCLT